MTGSWSVRSQGLDCVDARAINLLGWWGHPAVTHEHHAERQKTGETSYYVVFLWLPDSLQHISTIFRSC